MVLILGLFSHLNNITTFESSCYYNSNNLTSSSLVKIKFCKMFLWEVSVIIWIQQLLKWLWWWLYKDKSAQSNFLINILYFTHFLFLYKLPLAEVFSSSIIPYIWDFELLEIMILCNIYFSRNIFVYKVRKPN